MMRIHSISDIYLFIYSDVSLHGAAAAWLLRQQ